MSTSGGLRGASDAASGRSVTRLVPSTRSREGGGFIVRRPFPTAVLDHLDPFLLLDEMGPTDYVAGEAKGAPDHPHRGFETVTYLLDGEMEHKDSAGNSGRLRPGDVQWMTAGAGVVHSEMPSHDILSRGGRVHGFQLWVNLPRQDKMIAPRYQDTASARIPVVDTGDGVRVKVIAGAALGTRAVIDTHTPILYLHATLQPGARLALPVPASHNLFAFVFGGEGTFGAQDQLARDGHMVIFAHDADTVSLAAPAGAKEPLELLLVGGEPLREPVVRYGPFVMNSEQELVQAFEDFRSGRMGRIDGSPYTDE
jgi:redox-sensitive bicupin YhaK (pirin superfamily)